jgi:hypothetical protein
MSSPFSILFVELLMRPLFAALREQCSSDEIARWEVAPATRTAALHRNLFSSSPSKSGFAKQAQPADPNDPLAGKPLADVYHLWKLAGGSVERELAAAFAIIPPVCRLPALVVEICMCLYLYPLMSFLIRSPRVPVNRMLFYATGRLSTRPKYGPSLCLRCVHI